MTILDLPEGITPKDPDFVSILNRRLQDLAHAIDVATKPAAPAAPSGIATQYVGSHDERAKTYPAALQVAGTMYYEEDRTVWYAVVKKKEGQIWQYVSGQMRGTLNPNQKPTDLAADDANFLFYSTDFQHLYRWNGSAWAYATELGDLGADFISWFAIAPTIGVWQLANGSGANRSNANGTYSAISTPNLIGYFPRGATSYTGASVAFPTPTAVLSGSTAAEATHTHSAAAFGMTGPSSSTEVQSGTGSTVASDGHSHSITGSTGPGDSHLHAVGTLAATLTIGDPAHVDLLPYYRL